MLAFHPVGGAMFLKSLGMFLEGGRRNSMPQAHSLIHKADKGELNKNATTGTNPQELEVQVYRLSKSEILCSKRLKKCQKEEFMARLGEKKNIIKSQPKIIENLKKKTHFTRQEIDCLCKIYRGLVVTSAGTVSENSSPTIQASASTPINKVEGLDRTVFRELVHNAFDLVTEEVLIDRIFCAFDRNNDGVIKLDNWVCGLSTFLRGTLEERAAFCFLVYDLNADGYITRDELMNLLRNCLMKSPQDEDPEEGVRDLVELILRKIDVDKDGKISFDDYLQSVTAEPLLIEAFGQCLPTEAACQTFIRTLKS